MELQGEFDRTMQEFVGEASKAFPQQRGVLSDALVRFDEDKGGAMEGFAHDIEPHALLLVGRSSALLDVLGSTRLFQGFTLPSDALEANKQAVTEYACCLGMTAATQSQMGTDSMAKVLDIFQRADVPTEEGGVGSFLASEKGQGMVKEVAGALNLDVDMNDPIVQGILGMMTSLI